MSGDDVDVVLPQIIVWICIISPQQVDQDAEVSGGGGCSPGTFAITGQFGPPFTIS